MVNVLQTTMKRGFILICMMAAALAETSDFSDSDCSDSDEYPITKCRINEEYGCRYCQEECKTLNRPCGTANKLCVKGCYCKLGYARNDKGVCIAKGLCPPICDKPNEEYSCGSACQTRCDNYNDICPIINVKCNDWCYCKAGYARNGSDTAACIKYELCPKNPCPIHEHFIDCGGSPCQTKCSTLGKECLIKDDGTHSGCYCNLGYARNNKGICIPITKCPKPCPPNEHNIEDVDVCQKYCPALDKKCTNPIEANEYFHQCHCDYGYYRNASGICISVQQCPKPCQKNEYYVEDGSLCQTYCPALNKACTILPEDNNQCHCHCVKGFARNSKGICVPLLECSKPCPPNEHHVEDESHCQNYCKALNKKCTNTTKENAHFHRCHCNEGYFRNSSEVCVPVAECPIPCQPNEHYVDDGSLCQEYCPALDKQCTILSEENNKCHCHCDEGFVRNAKGICIPASECPKQCPSNEHHVEDASHCQNYCPALNKKCTNATNENVHFHRCHCNEGYSRNSLGVCIPVSECPIPCKPNEHFIRDGSLCQEYCPALKKGCRILPEDNNACNCHCNEGFIRNSKGTCIPISECPKPCPHNEHYIDDKNHCQDYCPALNRKCSNATEENNHYHQCHCDEGYVRNPSGKCISILDCPTCPQNEHFEECGSACQTKCATLGQECLILGDGINDNGCYCNEGFARDENRVCILIEDCST